MRDRWDAATYDRISEPQARWGAEVLDRLPLAGDERVLDAGCGTGRVTERLLERLPRGSVVALDASAEMLDEARRRLARFGDRVGFVHADLARPLPFPDAEFDAILSTATFHWIVDHDALFRHLAAVLRPGGRLVAQCGGAGNVASLERVVAELGRGSRGTHYFATAEETARRLEAAGFTGIEAWLKDEPTTFEAGAPFETFLETVVLRQMAAGMEPAERARFVATVAERMPGPVLDYVRLNVVAVRA